MRKWIKLVGGWQPVAGAAMERDFDNCCRSFERPVAREFPDRGLVKDDRESTPTFAVEGGWMIHQFHNLGVKLRGGDHRSMRFAHGQLKSLLEARYIIEGEKNAAT